MPNGNNNNGDWDGFNWQTWGEEASAHGDSDRRSGLNGAGGGADRDGHGNPAEFGVHGNGWREGESDEDTDQNAPGSGHWVRHGGVVSWEDDGEKSSDEPVSPRAEAQTVWADDDLDIPPGAPDALRVRAAHAWLARQRLLEEQAMGILLLERRRVSEGDDAAEAAGETRRREEAEQAPLDLALAEHQAAIEAYDAMIETLDGIAAHTGPSAVLVEFYLWLTEELARLAAAPEAPADFAERLLLVPVESEEAAMDARTPTTPRSSAEWQGRAEATAQARKRVEQVSALDPED